jgi:hypothetical protein
MSRLLAVGAERAHYQEFVVVFVYEQLMQVTPAASFRILAE